MKVLLFIFLIIQTQQYDQFTVNETSIAEHQFNEHTDKISLISNKVLIIIIVCLSIIVIATLLTVYFIKDQIKDFANRMSIGQRGSIIHHFHPETLLRSSNREQTSIVNENGKQQQSKAAVYVSLYH